MFYLAIETAPDHISAHMRLAEIFEQMESYSRAERHLLKILDVDADNKRAHAALARIYEALGDPHSAKQHRERARSLDE